MIYLTGAKRGIVNAESSNCLAGRAVVGEAGTGEALAGTGQAASLRPVVAGGAGTLWRGVLPICAESAAGLAIIRGAGARQALPGAGQAVRTDKVIVEALRAGAGWEGELVPVLPRASRTIRG